MYKLSFPWAMLMHRYVSECVNKNRIIELALELCWAMGKDKQVFRQSHIFFKKTKNFRKILKNNRDIVEQERKKESC